MWIMTPYGYVSVVESPDNPNMLQVRARHRRVLQIIRQGPEEGGLGKRRASSILHTRDSDYPYRIFVSKEDFSRWVAAQVQRIDYKNFKDAARTPDLHNLYFKIWGVVYRHYERNRQA